MFDGNLLSLQTVMSSPALDTSLLHQLSLAQMSQFIRERKLSPLELLGAHYTRIERLNPKLNAFIELRQEAAIAEARAAEEAVVHNAKVGALHGVPISIKSSIAVAGLKFECGSPTRRGIVASEDAVLVRRLKQAGAVVLGNTNVPEMLMAYETNNPLYGPTNSTWDLSRTPGGSSGGEAAAISAGLSAAGIGSDGGGSIRVPAHFSGICGLKPTPGRIPITGHWPESGGPFALLGVVGPMARSVEDLEIIFRVIAGFDAGDPMACSVSLAEVSEEELQRITIGYFEEHPSAPVTRDSRAAVQTAVTALQNSGVRVKPFLPDFFDEAREHWWTLFVRLGAELLTPQFKGREDQISTILTYSDRSPTKADLLSAWFRRDELRIRLMRQMNDIPVLVCPVCSVPAFRHEEREWRIGGQSVSYMDVMSYTQWLNLLGNPAVVVPVGVSCEGLPIGVQVVGQPNSEELILKVAGALEKAVGPPRMAPALLE